MTRDQIIELCRRATPVGAVKHEEFVDYILVLPQRKKANGGDEWTTVEVPYMMVDGKLAMANEDHRRQGKKLDFGSPQVLVDNADQLTLLVTITSEIYGTRHGIATSRRSGGSEIEREFPWEVAETSATGRALAAMGYGLFPGSGLASAEDMLRAGGGQGSRETNAERRSIPENGPRSQPHPPRDESPATPAARPRSPISTVQRRKLMELYHSLHGGMQVEVEHGLDALFVETFKHAMNEATYEEGAHITAQLLAAQRAR
ncbi:MAG: hypothetical protein WCF84_19995 [Anaerolineae bacterium]